MEFISLSCNKCGAPLEVPENAQFLTCGYCGSRLAIKVHGKAHYTEVLDRIDEKTSQILQKVTELSERNDPHALWEDCEVLCRPVKISIFKSGFQFVASAIGIYGRYEQVFSSVFQTIVTIENDERVPMQTEEALTAHEEIEDYLLEDGWEPVPYEGLFWFNTKYRRRV